MTLLPLAPSTRFERVAFRLGGGRSIQLSYEGLLICTTKLEPMQSASNEKSG